MTPLPFVLPLVCRGIADFFEELEELQQKALIPGASLHGPQRSGLLVFHDCLFDSICLSRFLFFCACELSARNGLTLVSCLPPIGHFDIYIFCTFCHGRFAWKPNALHEPCIHLWKERRARTTQERDAEPSGSPAMPSRALHPTSSNTDVKRKLKEFWSLWVRKIDMIR